jgi:nitroreductase
MQFTIFTYDSPINDTIVIGSTIFTESYAWMTTFDLIKKRRSIGKMTSEVPTHEQIERMLEAATHAPNHHKAEPWRFFVLTGSARERLGEIMVTSLNARLAEQTLPNKQAILDKEQHKPLRSPVLIIVASEHAQQPNILDIENIEAVAAAVENMLLTGAEMGLACIWRTGDAAYDPQVKQWLGLSNKDHIVAVVYVGFPAATAPERDPQPFSEKTTWLSE